MLSYNINLDAVLNRVTAEYMRKKPLIVTTSILIPTPLRDQLLKIAAQEGRSFAGQVRFFLCSAVLVFNTDKSK